MFANGLMSDLRVVSHDSAGIPFVNLIGRYIYYSWTPTFPGRCYSEAPPSSFLRLILCRHILRCTCLPLLRWSFSSRPWHSPLYCLFRETLLCMLHLCASVLLAVFSLVLLCIWPFSVGAINKYFVFIIHPYTAIFICLFIKFYLFFSLLLTLVVFWWSFKSFSWVK